MTCKVVTAIAASHNIYDAFVSVAYLNAVVVARLWCILPGLCRADESIPWAFLQKVATSVFGEDSTTVSHQEVAFFQIVISRQRGPPWPLPRLLAFLDLISTRTQLSGVTAASSLASWVHGEGGFGYSSVELEGT